MANLVALDLSRTGVRAIEVSGAHTTAPVVQRYGEIGLPEGVVFDGEVIQPGPFVSAIRQLWKEAKFSTRDVVFGAGNRKVLVREATVPHMPRSVLRQALPFQVQDVISMPVDETLLDFLPLEPVQAENPQTGLMEPSDRGLLIAAARDGITATARALGKARLTVETVDLTAFALSRLLAGPGVAGTSVVINIGASTTIVVITTNGIPQFIRMISSGGDDISRALMQPLSLTFAQAEQLKLQLGLYAHQGDERTQTAEQAIRENVIALIRSIKATVDYYTGAHPDAPVTRIVLSGGGSRLGGLQTVIEQTLGATTEYAQPLAQFALSRRVDDEQLGGRALELAAALGLTMGGR